MTPHGAGFPYETLGQAVRGDWLDVKTSEQKSFAPSLSVATVQLVG